MTPARPQWQPDEAMVDELRAVTRNADDASKEAAALLAEMNRIKRRWEAAERRAIEAGEKRRRLEQLLLGSIVAGIYVGIDVPS